MKYSIFILLTLFLSLKSFAQSQKAAVKSNEITIPINTELKVNVKENNGMFSNFLISEESTIKNTIDLMSIVNNREIKKIAPGKIEFKFSKADYKGLKLTILSVFHQFKKPILFKAKIRIQGTKNYTETSVVPKSSGVISVEQWQDDIDSIVLYDFKFYEK